MKEHISNWIINYFKSTQESVRYGIISLIGSFVTVIFNYLLILFRNNKMPESHELFGNGDSFIICIPLLITVIYSLFHSKNKKGFNGISGYVFFISILIILFCTILYPFFRNGEIIYSNIIYYSSIVIIIWTLLALSISHYYNNVSVDVTEIRNTQQANLEDKFRKL